MANIRCARSTVVSSIIGRRSSISILLHNDINHPRYFIGRSSLPAYAIWIGKVEPRPYRSPLMRWQAYWKSLFPKLMTMPFEPFLYVLRRAWKGNGACDKGLLMNGRDATLVWSRRSARAVCDCCAVMPLLLSFWRSCRRAISCLSWPIRPPNSIGASGSFIRYSGCREMIWQQQSRNEGWASCRNAYGGHSSLTDKPTPLDFS